MSRIKEMTEKVKRVLEVYPETRNDDRLLTLMFWKMYYPTQIIIVQVYGRDTEVVRTSSVLDLPSEDKIGRVRRKFQESGQFLPTRWEVAKQRRIQEEVWRTAMQGTAPAPSEPRLPYKEETGV